MGNGNNVDYRPSCSSLPEDNESLSPVGDSDDQVLRLWQ